MSDAREPDEGDGDLLGRWLAHREETEEDTPRPRTYGVPRTGRGGDPERGAPAHRAPAPPSPAPSAPTSPTAPTASTPRTPSTPRPPATPPPPATPTAPREPVGLEDFEPVVIASVRRAAEAPVEPPRSRLRGGRRRAATPPVTEPDAEVDAEPDAQHVEPDIEPEVEPDVEPDAAEDPGPRRESHPHPVAESPEEPAGPSLREQPATPGQPDKPAAPEQPEQPAAPRQSEQPAPTGRRRAGGRPSLAPSLGTPLAAYAARARTALDRSVRGTPEERLAGSPRSALEPAEAPADLTDPTDPTGPDSPAGPGAPVRSAYDELRAQREAAAPPRPDVLPPDLDFRPRTGARTATSLLLLVGLVATGIASWRAYDSRVETDIGLAAILALATGVVWAVRAGTVPTRVGLHGGRLEVRTQAGRFVFELTNVHTTLEMVGTPGRRGWRVLVHRRGLAPFVITAAMVDPHELTEALRYYRPDL